MLTHNDIQRRFNTVRLTNTGKSFTGSEIRDLMQKNGISGKVFQLMQKDNAFFMKVRNGNIVNYWFTKEPVGENHFKRLWGSYQEQQKHQINEEHAIAFLKSRGYRISKVEGVDTDKLRTSYPQIYAEMLVVKEI